MWHPLSMPSAAVGGGRRPALIGDATRLHSTTKGDGPPQRSRSFSAEYARILTAGNTVYALDTTTIDLSLKVFPWAHFRKAKAAVKMHTRIDLRGNIPSFIHVSDGKMHEVNVLDLKGLLRCPRFIYI